MTKRRLRSRLFRAAALVEYVFLTAAMTLLLANLSLSIRNGWSAAYNQFKDVVEIPTPFGSSEI